MLHWTDCDIFCLYSFDASSCFIGWIVTFCVCNIVYLCSFDSTSSCFRLIATLFICVLMVLSRVAFDWLCYCLSVFPWFFPVLYWIDCDIVYLCSHGSFSCCLGLIVALYIWVLIVLPHVALDWLWIYSYIFSWFFLRLHWIDCGIFYLCSHGSFSCCLGLIVAWFIWVLIVLTHVALDWLWHCLSVFSWFILMLHWINCDIVYLSFHCSSSCCFGLILTLYICVLKSHPHVALDWLWHCLSVFSCIFLVLPWIDCGIVYLSSYSSSSCCIGLIVNLFICVLMVLPQVA